MKASAFAFGIALLAAQGAICSVITYDVVFDGPSESPPNASPGTGFGTAAFDTAAHTLTLQVAFSGLLGTTTASHIHCCTLSPFTLTAGVATTTPSFTGFPLGVTSGSFSAVLDLTDASSYNPTYVTNNGGTTAGAEAALEAGAALGEAYWNIHTTVVPGGEIRGFLVAETPEPGTFALGGCLLAALFAVRKRFARA